MKKELIDAINELSIEIHQDNVKAGWWTDLKYNQKIEKLKSQGFDDATIEAIFSSLNIKESTLETRNVGELLCLTISEVSEAMEGVRKNLMDDKLPHRKMFEVELADTLIRIFDIAGAYNLDLGGAISEKRAYNAIRKDHKIETRLEDNGKKF